MIGPFQCNRLQVCRTGESIKTQQTKDFLSHSRVFWNSTQQFLHSLVQDWLVSQQKVILLRMFFEDFWSTSIDGMDSKRILRTFKIVSILWNWMPRVQTGLYTCQVHLLRFCWQYSPILNKLVVYPTLPELQKQCLPGEWQQLRYCAHGATLNHCARRLQRLAERCNWFQVHMHHWPLFCQSYISGSVPESVILPLYKNAFKVQPRAAETL